MQTGRSPLNDEAGQPYPRLQQLLRAIKKERGKPRRERLPITTDLLRQIIGILDRTAGIDIDLFKYAFALATYGMLRVGEFMAPRTAQFDRAVQANLQDVTAYPNLDGPTHVTMLIRASKTDPFRNTHLVTIHATGQTDCPVKIITCYLQQQVEREGSSPLFVLNNGKYLTRAKVGTGLRTALEKLGLNERAYAPHSFRIGATVSLAAAGVPSYVISILERWSSDCYLLYLKLTPSILAAVYKKIGSITAHDVETRGDNGRR